MNRIAFTLTIFMLMGFSFLGSQAFGQQVNLLAEAKSQLVGKSGTNINTATPLYDKDPDTAILFKLGIESVDLVFGFDNQAVAIKRLGVLTKGLKADTASVEILASTLSTTEGYRSLQSSPLRVSDQQPQVFNFVDSSAKWVMIRFMGLQPGASVEVAEIELIGTVGELETTYKFDESPAEAIKVLSQLSSSVKVKFSKSETDMFEDAQDGKFDNISFSEASLLSCGVYDAEKRKQHLARIEDMFQQAVQRTSGSESAFDKGKILLEMLHGDALRNGYREKQTDVSQVLEDQTYNCVSSATLYNILARKLGLDARGIEVPDHAFSILYDGTDHVDIETTNGAGFNPARNKAALEQFQNQTGFVYIPDRNRSSRREVGEPGLVAITYYNHGVTFSKEKQFNEALIQYFKALSLDPQNKSAVKNVLATLANWSAQLADQGDFKKAVEVVTTGLVLAPDDWRIKNNNIAIWQQYIKEQIEADNSSAVLSELKAAAKNTNNKDLAKLQSMVFLLGASKMTKDEQWEGAIDFARTGVEEVDETARTEIANWVTNATLRWSNLLIDDKDFSTATDVLAKTLDSSRGSAKWRLENQIAYVVQQWAADEKENNGEEAGRTLLAKLTERFPKLRKFQSVSNSFTYKAVQELLKKKDYEGALKLYAQAREQNPKDYRLKQNESAVWVMMAKPAMEARDWATAIEIYQRAYAARSDEHVFSQNLVYIVQEWSTEVARQDGPAAGEKVVSEWAEKLPKIYGIEQMKGSHVATTIRKQVDEEAFETAAELLSENKNVLRNSFELEKWATYIYQQQTQEMVKAGDWEAAIKIYENGIEKFEKCTKLKRSLANIWNGWALKHIDKKEWKKALEILEKAEVSVPGQSVISNNIRYCKSKLK